MPDLLWIDDDGHGMFLFEVYQLEQEGWTVHFATHLAAAAEALSTRTFDAVLLDQMMPLGAGDDQPVDVWAGCLVAWWLRTGTPPPGAPGASIEATAHLWAETALPTNRSLPMVMVSAFDDAEVEAQVRGLVPEPSPVPILVKPVDATQLLAHLSLPEERAS